MVGPSSTVDQNILPVQAYFNLDGSFNTFIGQGQPFVVSATESIGIINTSVSGTFYPTFTAVNTGQITSLSVTSSVYKFNPGTGELSAPFFDGTLNGTATEANNIAGGSASQLVYQTGANTTGFVPNGISGQFLVSNGSSAPSWSSVATSVTIVDQTSSSSTFYPLFYSATSGSTNTVETSSTKLQYIPSTGTLISTVFSGSGASLTNIPNSALTNASFTLGSTSISLGSTTTTIAGLTSVTSTTFVGALSGNATTATSAVTATNANNVAITDNTSSIATWYPMIVSNTTGNLPATTSSTKLSFVPSTGTLAVANLNLTNALGIAYGGTNSTATPTAGGVGYGTGTAHAYSAVGTSGQVLTSAGAGVPIWTTPTTGTVTSVTGTAPVVSSGGNTPVISMAAATTSVNGYLTSTDWTTFNGKQATLVSGTNIKTVGGVSLLGSGDVGTIGVAYGGTGVATLTGFAYGNGTSAFTAATTAQALSLIGTLPVGNGGTGLTTLTANYIPYGNGTNSFQSSANFTFDGTTLVTVNDAQFHTVKVGLGGGSIATNTVVGNTAFTSNSTGGSNSIYGYQAGYYALGNSNTVFGYQAMYGFNTLTTGGNNTVIGSKAGANITTGAYNVYIGAAEGSVGTSTGQSNTTGYANTGVGTGALAYSTTAINLSAFGYQAGWKNTTGFVDAFGSGSLLSNLTGTSLSGFGQGSLNYNTIGSNNVGFGQNSGTRVSSSVATLGAITGGSGYTTGTYTNVVMTLSSGTAAGTYPTATIVVAGGAVTTVTITSPGNRFVDTTTVLTAPAASIGGTGAGFTVPVASLATGANNTFIGSQSGWKASTNPNTTGSNNTFVGYNTIGSTSTDSNSIVIGASAIGLGSNTTVIGTSSTVLTQVYGTLNTNGYTVATLPSTAANGMIQGARAYVTDATLPTYLGTLTGGGTVKCPVFYNGTAWVSA